MSASLARRVDGEYLLLLYGGRGRWTLIYVSAGDRSRSTLNVTCIGKQWEELAGLGQVEPIFGLLSIGAYFKVIFASSLEWGCNFLLLSINFPH